MQTARARAAEAGCDAEQGSQLGNDIAALQALKAELERETASLAQRSEQAEAGLIEERKISESARAQLALLNQQTAALREQIAQLAAALDASEKKAAEQQVQITALGQRLNAALAGKVQELARYRSEFFGRLREVLGDNPDIRIVGDRFVFPSEVLFAVGSADLGDRRPRPDRPRRRDAEADRRQDPAGHRLDPAGRRPHRPGADQHRRSFRRTGSCRRRGRCRCCGCLTESGIPPRRLAAAGYAEYQPIDAGDGEAAYRRNRRIELKLTQR